MLRKRTSSLITVILLAFFSALPAYGLVIEGPTLNQAEGGWGDFGLVIRAEADTTLLSVEFPNQGLADVIQLRRYLDDTLLASIPVPAGNNEAIVDINYPLTANEAYKLVATTPNNRYYGELGVFAFPVSNPELTVETSYLGILYTPIGIPYPWLWFTFNNITTGTVVTEPEPLEAVIDVKPTSIPSTLAQKA